MKKTFRAWAIIMACSGLVQCTKEKQTNDHANLVSENTEPDDSFKSSDRWPHCLKIKNSLSCLFPFDGASIHNYPKNLKSEGGN